MDAADTNLINYFLEPNDKKQNKEVGDNKDDLNDAKRPSHKPSNIHNINEQINTMPIPNSFNPSILSKNKDNQKAHQIPVNNPYASVSINPMITSPIFHQPETSFYNNQYPLAYYPPNKIQKQTEMAYKLGSDSYTSLSLLDSTPVFPNQFQNKSYFQQSKSQLYSPFFPQHSFPSMSSYPNTYPIKNPNLLSSPSIVNQLPSLLNPTPTIETSSVNKTSKDNNNSILQSKGLSNPSANEKMVHNVMTNEECKELKLSRDRAAARLRRMRKKSTIEISELKISYIDERLEALKSISPGERRENIFSCFNCNGGLVFSNNERLNQFQFLLNIFKYIYKRYENCLTLLSILLQTTQEESENAIPSIQLLANSKLKLSDKQKELIRSLLPQIHSFHCKLNGISWLIACLSLNTNLLILPEIDKGNDMFTSVFTSSQIRSLYSFFKQNETVIQQLSTSLQPPTFQFT